MSQLVADCPRCKSHKITFDVTRSHHVKSVSDWQHWFETFSICRHCDKSTVFVLSLTKYDLRDTVLKNGLTNLPGTINSFFKIEGYINLKDLSCVEPPEHLPENIEEVFREGATCLAVECYNASATMFRLCIDLATVVLLPDQDRDGLNSRIRRNLGLRLPWLFDNALLPSELRELSTCIKDDGNDGAHAGTLIKEDAEDLLDFVFEFLERLYTEPARLRLAQERRDARRQPNST